MADDTDVGPADALTAEIKRRTSLFVKDNFTEPTMKDWLIVNSAMTIGALIAKEQELAEALAAVVPSGGNA